MNANPVDLIGGMTTSANVPKADVSAWAKARVAQILADATEVRNTTLAGQQSIAVKSTGFIYYLNTSSTANDDGFFCIISGDGYRYMNGSSLSIRKLLTASTTIFVDTANGLDTNSGLAPGAGNALKTMTAAALLAYSFDSNAKPVIIQCAAGTYTAGIAISGPLPGGGPFYIIGDPAAGPAAVIWSVTSNNCLSVGAGAVVNIQGFEFRTATAGDATVCYDGGEIIITGDCRFGTCVGSHRTSFNHGRYHGAASYHVVGNCGSHRHEYGQGYQDDIAITIFIVGALTVSNYWEGNACAFGAYAGVAFDLSGGSVTGKKFLVHDFGRIDTSLSGISFLPGSIAGTFDTWGSYDQDFHGTFAFTFMGSSSGSSVLGANSTGVLQYPGTPTNDNATAGCIGEYVESVIPSGSAVSLVNATPKNLTSISLTAGDWDVDVNANFLGTSSTTVVYLGAGISLTTGTVDQTNGRFVVMPFFNGAAYNFVPALIVGMPVPPVRISLSTTTTVFAVAQAGFGGSTQSVFGILRARRVR